MNKRLALAACSGVLLVVSACGGGGSSSGSTSNTMLVDVASNGFGKLLPHQIFVADSQGLPSSELIEITREQDLFANLTPDNLIIPPTVWDTDTLLPNGDQGNHFIYARFRLPIDPASVLEPSQGAVFDDNLRGPIRVLAFDPTQQKTIPVSGRAFIGGFTYGNNPDPDNPGDLLFEKWVELVDGANGPVVSALVPEAIGFPGTQSTNTFGGIADLVDERTFLFIPDADNNLATHETFPAGQQILMRMTTDVASSTGRNLASDALASSTVGLDDVAPEVAIAGQQEEPQVIPGNGEIGVDPASTITVRFTEPINLLSIGDLDDGGTPSLGAGIGLAFGPVVSRVNVPFGVRVPSVFDLSTVQLVPAYTFPGSPPPGVQASCGDFSTVDVVIASAQFNDLAVGQSETVTVDYRISDVTTDFEQSLNALPNVGNAGFFYVLDIDAGTITSQERVGGAATPDTIPANGAVIHFNPNSGFNFAVEARTYENGVETIRSTAEFTVENFGGTVAPAGDFLGLDGETFGNTNILWSADIQTADGERTVSIDLLGLDHVPSGWPI